MRPRSILVLATVLTASWAGCMGSEPEGTVSVYVRGEPRSDLQEVQVNLSSVHVRPTGEAETDGTEPPPTVNTDRFPENWTEVELAPAEVEMTFSRAASDAPRFFGEGPVPAGNYDAVGVLVEGVHAVDRNGTPVNVRVTDAVTDVRTNFSVPSENETRIVLTLDVADSFSPAESQEEGWLFTPRVAGVNVAHVEDGASGGERHDPGQRANLSR